MEVEDDNVVPASVPPPVAPAAAPPRPTPIKKQVEDGDSRSFRQRYQDDLRELKDRHRGMEHEFSDDDMNETLTEEERRRGWGYALTKTQQKKEYGCVVAEQQRFLWHLQDGHLDVVEDYIGIPKKRKAINIDLYDEQGWTPLHYASQRNFTDIVKALLDAGANAGLKDKVCGMTALDMAKMGTEEDAGPNDDVIDALRAYGIRA